MQRTIPAVLTLAALVVAVAACSGGKGSNSSTTTTTTTTASSPGASPVASAGDKMTAAAGGGAAAGNGSKIYNTNCSSCHQTNGKGQPGVFPPLAGNPVVTGSPAKVIHIVKNGLSGKIQVKGNTYNGQMPPWKGTLSDADIAAVITYVRSSWGNHASAVTAATVTSTK